MNCISLHLLVKTQCKCYLVYALNIIVLVVTKPIYIAISFILRIKLDLLDEVLSIFGTKVSIDFYIFFFISKLINITSDVNILAFQLMELFLILLDLELPRKLQMKRRCLLQLKCWILLIQPTKIILRFRIIVAWINHFIKDFFIIEATILSGSIFLGGIYLKTAMLLKWLIPLYNLSTHHDISSKFTSVLLTYSPLKYSISTFISIIWFFFWYFVRLLLTQSLLWV